MRRPGLSARWLGRGLVGLVVVVVWAGAAPAGQVAAHGGGGADASNYLITVTDPGDPALVWRVYGGDALIELTNHSGEPVEVVGYQGEPYLRFVPDEGVFENTRSPATYLNRDRYGDVTLPADADADAAPVWRRVSRGDRFAWHDHRAHWMSPTPPAMVDTAPDVEHLVQSWTVPLRIGEPPEARTVEAAGTLQWVPPVAWWPPVVATATVFAAVMVVAAACTRPRGPRWPAVVRTAVVLVWLVAAANLVRGVDDVAAVPASTAEQVVVLLVTVVAVAAVVALSIGGWRARQTGFMGVAAAGVLAMLLFAADSTDQLSASQIATVLPVWVRRWTVAASYTIVIPAFTATAIAAMLYRRHLAGDPDHPSRREDPSGTSARELGAASP